jgi:hypothetical protein
MFIMHDIFISNPETVERRTSQKLRKTDGHDMAQASVAGSLLQWPRFNPGSGHVALLVDEVFSEHSTFSCQFSFHQLLHIH